MELMPLRIFQAQIAGQCRMALHGAEVIETGLQCENNDFLWIGVQTLLTGAANTAKALWGAGGRLSDERRPLRESLNIDDRSPLRDVSMRNHFEHFDERIDLWWKKSESHNYLDGMIGSPDNNCRQRPLPCLRFFS